MGGMIISNVPATGDSSFTGEKAKKLAELWKEIENEVGHEIARIDFKGGYYMTSPQRFVAISGDFN